MGTLFRKEVVIKHIVDDKSTGFYTATDLLEKTITIGKRTKRMRLSLWEAERLEFLLRRQIDRLKGDYPKKPDREQNEFLICPNCGRVEKSTANFCGNCGNDLSSVKKEK